ncbi:hypothetical protein KGF54_005452 [Candida jiufengensis]|uniref:uncharacterized protein n=1 Tax=Candida jiufengensis TaxID=497108 RepID=UPI002225A936|nr:uncharacterized protein KGF54_005452 [Candida jiufengensis]KAI5949575.1 hypothetical protein KGF54_005452 [Candida jiufengensis]
MSEKFPASSIVLAKVKGYPAWPAMVLAESFLPDNIISKKPKHKTRDLQETTTSTSNVLPIKFFNDDTYFWMKIADLKPLSKDDIAIHFAQTSSKRKKDKVLEQAYELASNPLDMETFIKYGSSGEPPEIDEDVFEDNIEIKAPPRKKLKVVIPPRTKTKPVTVKKDPRKEALEKQKEEERKLMAEYDSDWGIDDFNKYDKSEGNYIYETKEKQQELFSTIPDSSEILEIYNDALDRYKTLEYEFLNNYLINEDEQLNYKLLQKNLKEFEKMVDEIPKSITNKSKILRLLILSQRKQPSEDKNVQQFHNNIEKILKKLGIEVRENTEEDFEIKSVDSTKLTTPEITSNPESTTSSTTGSVEPITDVKEERVE